MTTAAPALRTKLFSYIDDNPGCTTADLLEVLKCNINTLYTALKYLRENKCIKVQYSLKQVNSLRQGGIGYIRIAHYYDFDYDFTQEN